MKFTIARLLALLVAGVALLTTFAVGQVALTAGRQILIDHKITDLEDEANLRLSEIRDDVRVLGVQARSVAGRMRAAELTPDDPGLQAALQNQFPILLDRSTEAGFDSGLILGVAVLAVDAEGKTQIVLVADREGDGLRFQTVEEQRTPHPLLESMQRRIQQDAQQARLPGGKPAATQYLQLSTLAEGSEKPQLLGVAVAFHGGEPAPSGYLVVLLDFYRLIFDRARRYPRQLFFVIDQSGLFRFHPDREKVGTLISSDRDPKTGKSRWTFEPMPWPNPTGKRQEAERSLLRTRGAGIRDLALPSLAYWYVRQPISPEFADQHWQTLNAQFQQAAQADPRIRYAVLHERSRAVEFSVPNREQLVRFEKLVADLKPSEDSAGRAIHCETFAAHLVILRPNADPAQDLSLGLIVTVALEEIVLDATMATTWFWWWGLGLCLAAGCLGFLPAWAFTRRLERLNQAAQQVAKGNYTTTDLPTGAIGEVGELARSFRTMAEQIRQRDRELKGNLARLESVLRNASEGIITFDERGVIMAFNDAAERMFRYSPREVIGQKVHMLIRWPDNVASGRGPTVAEGGSISAFAAVMQAQSEITLGSRKDGGKFWMEVSFSEVPLGDRKLITGIFRDVTRRKEDEEKIRQINAELKELNRQLDARVQARTAELESANSDLKKALEAAQAAKRATDTFVANMSHELRQPLNIIIGFAETIQEELTDEANAQFAPDLDRILRAARHLLSLINDVLDYAKMAAGVMKLEIKEFDLGGLVREAAQWTEHLLNGNTLETDFATDLGKVRADERRVRQVLINLLSNACKFTTNGKVTFRVRRETVQGTDWIELAVRDTGPGMTPEELARLFQRFWQADATTQRKHGGAGLGLTISRGLCEMMGGSIRVTSQVGVGSEFIVRLPAVVRAEVNGGTAGRPVVPAPQSSASRARPPALAGTVLVIDDDPGVRELMERFLVKQGFQVLLAESAEEGIRLARERRPALITLDVMMPGIDGWALLAALKSDSTTHDIPVVMLTIVDDRGRGFHLGASEYVTKPIDWERLRGILNHYSHRAGTAPVLVVDDDAHNRELIGRMLRKDGWAIVEAENGRVGLQRLSEQRPALILLDLMMPEMDGFEFLDELHRRPDLAGLPVVVLTAKDLSDEERRRLNGSVEQIIRRDGKTEDDLLEWLRGWLQGQAPGAPRPTTPPAETQHAEDSHH